MLDFGYYKMDCMDGMKEFPDKYFDLAIVDPPYGIETRGHAQDRFRMGQNLSLINDAKPQKQYFEQLFRVSKNQIIWGYNHLSDMLPSCREFIFWYKHNPVDTFSDGELAWTSFQKTAKCFDYNYFGNVNVDKSGKIHPTQKPVALYEWILSRYAKDGDIILDTHVGSASSLIACHNTNHKFVGFELDEHYYKLSKERLDREMAQMNLFDFI